MKRLCLLMALGFMALYCSPSENGEIHPDAESPWADQPLAYQQEFESEARVQRAYAHIVTRCCGNNQNRDDKAAALDSLRILAELDYPPALHTLAHYYADSTELSLRYLRRAAELGSPTAIEELENYNEYLSSDDE